MKYQLAWRSVWRKAIKGYGGRYHVTFFGGVFSNPKKRGPNSGEETKGRYLKPTLHTSGYLTVTLYKKTKEKSVPKRHYVHRLVAEAFVPNPHSFRFIHHIDGDKTNNNKNNLVWVSQSILKRELQGEDVPSLFRNFYLKVKKYHGAEIQRLHKQGETTENLSNKYKVSEGWISLILGSDGLRSIPNTVEGRRAAVAEQREDAEIKRLLKLNAEI